MPRFLGNKNTREVHDLFNKKPNCQIDEIKPENIIYFTPDTLVQGHREGYDNCALCLGTRIDEVRSPSVHIHQQDRPEGIHQYDEEEAEVIAMKHIKRICRHCGNETLHAVIHTHTRPDQIYDQSGEYLADFIEYYYFTKCETCTNISIFANWDLDDDWYDDNRLKIFYPEEWQVSDNVPDRIRRDLLAANRVMKIEPLAYVVLIRRALEQICIDLWAF